MGNISSNLPTMDYKSPVIIDLPKLTDPRGNLTGHGEKGLGNIVMYKTA